MSSLFRRLAGGLCLTTGLAAAAADVPPVPVASATPMRWEIDYTTAVLWKVGGGATPLPYVFVPQIISFKIPPIHQWPWAGGTLMMRSRFSLLLEPIVRGPEHYFLGTAAAGELEWRDHSERFAWFFASGGGFGWMDSRGYQVRGGQGQDFNLNWLIHSGLRYQTRGGWLWSAGVYFQHISNRGMNRINPGVNALGPTIGLARRF